MRLFGPRKEDVWRELAQRIDGRYTPGTFRRTSTVAATRGCWTITLDTYTVSGGETAQTHTRLRTRFVSRDGFRFTLHRRSIFTKLGEMFGAYGIEIGDAEFDSAFVVKATDADKAAALLRNDNLRSQIEQQPSGTLRVIDDEGRFGPAFHERVDELWFDTEYVIRDIERLESLFALFEETLRQLCRIGSAYEMDPNGPIELPAVDLLLRGASAPPDPGVLLRPSAEPEEICADELPRAVD